MKQKPFPTIRMDDVLQVTGISKHQAYCVGDKSFFEHFKRADKFFRKTQYPCTLAICAEGIEVYPEWVEHIKNNIHRYKIELHCNKHQNYRFLSKLGASIELACAIGKITNTFDVRPTVWYPPKGRKGEPVDKDEICRNLRIECFKQVGKVDAKLWFKNPKQYPHVNFHFWHGGQVITVNSILREWQVQQGKRL